MFGLKICGNVKLSTALGILRDLLFREQSGELINLKTRVLGPLTKGKLESILIRLRTEEKFDGGCMGRAGSYEICKHRVD